MIIIHHLLLKKILICFVFTIIQLFPKLCRSSCMRNYNCSAYNVGNSKNFINFICIYSQLITFAKMIFNTVITTQNHACNKAKHFFCLTRHLHTCWYQDSINASTQDYFYKNNIIHACSVIIEIIYRCSHTNFFVKIPVIKCGLFKQIK